MSEHHPPIVPHVLYVANQSHPWRLAPCERLKTRYHTPTTVSTKFGTVDATVRPQAGKRGVNKQQHQVHCLPDDAAWNKVQETRAALQQSIDALADGLRRLGRYAERLAEAGGIKRAPNPLCRHVINAPDPNQEHGYFVNRPVPQIDRRRVTSHTPKMLRGPTSYNANIQYSFHQDDHFVCQDDAAWEQILTLHKAAEEAAREWDKLKRELGTYEDAIGDGRYAARAIESPAAAPLPAAPQHEEDSMAWDYRSVLKGGQVKFAGGRWACVALRERYGQRVGISYHREYKGMYERAATERIHPDSAPTVWTTEADVRSRTKIGRLLFAGAEDAVEEELETTAPARLIETSTRADTDLDDELFGRLQDEGWTWESSKQTPDRRWHHIVRKHGDGGFHGRLRRERLEALIAPATPVEQEQPTVQPIDRAIRSGDLVAAEQLVATRSFDRPGALPAPLQECARRYIAARERAGDALLEMAAELAQARRLAQHGTWYIFLEAIGTSEDQADRLLDIHSKASESPEFADAVRRNFLNPTTAALLARPSTPAAVVEQVLAEETAPSKREVEQQIRKARGGGGGGGGGNSKSRTGAGFEEAPAQPAASDPFYAPAAKVARDRAAALGIVLAYEDGWMLGGDGPMSWPDIQKRLAKAEATARTNGDHTCAICREVARQHLDERGSDAWLCGPHYALLERQIGPNGPTTDAARAVQIRKVIARAGKATGVERQQLCTQATIMARQIQDGDVWRALVGEINTVELAGRPAQNVEPPAPTPPLPDDLVERMRNIDRGIWIDTLNGGYMSGSTMGAADYQNHADLAAVEAYLAARPTCEHCGAPAADRRNIGGVKAYRCVPCRSTRYREDAQTTALRLSDETKRLLSEAGAVIQPDGTVVPPPHSGEQPGPMDTAAVYAALRRWKERREALSAPSAPQTITIHSSAGERTVEATLLTADLALHPAIAPDGRLAAGAWTITHRASGYAVASLRTQDAGERTLSELSELDWSQFGGDWTPSPQLRDGVVAILTRYAVDRVRGPVQAAPEAPPAAVEEAPEIPPVPAEVTTEALLKVEALRKATGLLRHGFRLLSAETIILRLIALGICDRDQRGLIAEMERRALEDLIVGRIFAGAWSGDPLPLLELLKVEVLAEQEVTA